MPGARARSGSSVSRAHSVATSATSEQPGAKAAHRGSVASKVSSGSGSRAAARDRANSSASGVSSAMARAVALANADAKRGADDDDDGALPGLDPGADEEEEEPFFDSSSEDEREIKWGAFEELDGAELHKMTRRYLKNHLEARNLAIDGPKRDLVARLSRSVDQERIWTTGTADALEAEHQANCELEELGSVYVIGCNNAGQLGLGDTEPRDVFTVLPALRGVGIRNVSAGYNMCFAVSEGGDVYRWGGGGVGPDARGAPAAGPPGAHLEPTVVQNLVGEDIVQVAVGAAHAVAVSDGGDCFSWGFGRQGQLGLGSFDNQPLPELVPGMQSGSVMTQAAAGESHTTVLTREGTLYAWGVGADGRLGVGATSRQGVEEREAGFFPGPCLITALRLEQVLEIACGASHVLARSRLHTYAWGSGAGGKLGTGDYQQRLVPTRIAKLEGKHVMRVSCSTWHSAAVVVVPPLVAAGWVYTWGSGQSGQLGQGGETTVLEPRCVDYFRRVHITVTEISCGPTHNMCLTRAGELYSFGGNESGQLARDLDDDVVVSYTAEPGHVGGFGAIVGRIGRGMPRSFACGKGFTIVATYPYEGPSEAVARRLVHEEEIRKEEIAQRLLAEERRRRRMQRTKQDDGGGDEGEGDQRALCDICVECPGFQRLAQAPNLCRECSHPKSYHNGVPEVYVAPEAGGEGSGSAEEKGGEAAPERPTG